MPRSRIPSGRADVADGRFSILLPQPYEAAVELPGDHSPCFYVPVVAVA
jgi:hypothetical protein